MLLVFVVDSFSALYVHVVMAYIPKGTQCMVVSLSLSMLLVFLVDSFSALYVHVVMAYILKGTQCMVVSLSLSILLVNVTRVRCY